MARPHSFHLHSDVVDFDTDPQTYRKVILGDGGFAVVYRGRYCRDTPVAIKVLKSQDQQGQYERLRVKLVHEVEKWQGLTHGNILQFHGYITEPLAMVAEIADGGDLRQLLNRAIQQPGLLDRDGPRILLQIAKGMSYLHSRDVLHCDLKPENVVISGDVCRVSDFGLAAVRDAMGTEGGIPLGGTLGYIAPEVFANPPIRNKLSDVWSYGVIAFEVFSETHSAANWDRDRRPRPYRVDDRSWNLISSCTNPLYHERNHFWKIVDILTLNNEWRVDGRPLQCTAIDGSARAPAGSTDFEATLSRSFVDLPSSLDLNSSPSEPRPDGAGRHLDSAVTPDVDDLLRRGLALENGDGVPRNLEAAVSLFRQAADLSDPRGQFAVGWACESGRGAEKDLAEAFSWYRKAAEKGHIDACVHLGWCYEFAKGTAADVDEAVRWYRIAAERGEPRAQYALGWAHKTGRGAAKDDSLAFAWFKKAADQGHEDASNMLAAATT